MDRLSALRPLSLTDVLRSSATWRIRWRKLCDVTVGRLLVQAVGPAPRSPGLPLDGPVTRILVIRPGGIGDAVLLMPFLRTLKAAYPRASLDVLAERRNAEVFAALDGTIRSCYRYDERPWKVWRDLRGQSYDLIFDTEQWHHLSALVCATLRAPARIGFDTNPARNRCYTRVVAYDQQGFEGENFIRMLSSVLGREVRVDWTQSFVPVRPADAAWVAERIGERAAVALALRGSVPERCWEPEKLEGVMSRLLNQGMDICLLGAPADRPLADRLIRRFPPGRIQHAVGVTSVGQAAALLGRCRLFIGTDSGLLQLAYGVGTPTVALFGAGIASKWAPRGANHRLLNRHLPCSPCTRFGCTPRCPRNVQCLREITVDEVADAACDLIRAVTIGVSHTAAAGIS